MLSSDSGQFESRCEGFTLLSFKIGLPNLGDSFGVTYGCLGETGEKLNWEDEDDVVVVESLSFTNSNIDPAVLHLRLYGCSLATLVHSS